MFFQLIGNQFFAGKNKSEDFSSATNTLCGSPLHGKFVCFIALEYYFLFCFRTFCLSKCFTIDLFVIKFFCAEKNKSEVFSSATNTMCGSPFAELKLVQVKDRWVVKGRLKFTRTYPTASKHFNLRYPYARKVFAFMWYVKCFGLRGCVVITC